MIHIEITTAVEVDEFVKSSVQAFASDALHYNVQGGPPNYDSLEWHYQMFDAHHLYSIKDNDVLVGGIILFLGVKDKHVAYVGRLFIHPLYHRHGYATKAMLLLEESFPEVKLWKLETPIWNERTNRLYQKLGYTEINCDSEQVYYQKRLGK
ncbi:MAG: GNAT family N-acetyltransferase [Bacteroidia bacterium]|nr:GNAT family N-acetyltransferase [Bacteroidia bacterium]